MDLTLTWLTWLLLRGARLARAAYPYESEGLVGMWYFDEVSDGLDLSGHGNHAQLVNLEHVPGPLGVPGSATQLPGNARSYIRIPNNGDLDLRHSFSLVMEVRSGCEGPGPLFQWGVGQGSLGPHVWEYPACTLYVGLTDREGALLGRQLRVRGALPQHEWVVFTVTYDGASGRLAVWVDGAPRKHVNLTEKTALGTFHDVNIGGRLSEDNNDRPFLTQTSSAKLFNRVLSDQDIRSARLRFIECPGGTFLPPRCTGRCHCAQRRCAAGNGTCSSECEPGWRGTSCDAPCGALTWGPGCRQRCHCPADKQCDIRTGACPSVCADGWDGPACNVDLNLPTPEVDTTPRVTFTLTYFVAGCVALGLALLVSLLCCAVFFRRWRVHHARERLIARNQKLLRRRQYRQISADTQGRPPAISEHDASLGTCDIDYTHSGHKQAFLEP